MERAAKDMTDRVTYLENRVVTLEMENKLLKDLITEKSGKEVNMEELTRHLGHEIVDEVEMGHRKKGVGTVSKEVKDEA